MRWWVGVYLVVPETSVIEKISRYVCFLDAEIVSHLLFLERVEVKVDRWRGTEIRAMNKRVEDHMRYRHHITALMYHHIRLEEKGL